MALRAPGNRFLRPVLLSALVAVLLVASCNTPPLVGGFDLSGGGAGGLGQISIGTPATGGSTAGTGGAHGDGG
jgi:hypothetical protein